MKPKALDLFCKARGASMGLSRAGYDVTGVDIEPQPRYPFRFIQADALTFPLEGYDLIWASPPCQMYSSLKHKVTKPYPLLIPQVRQRLRTSAAPYIIENVIGAPLENPVLLCGWDFGLKVYRHRLFESNMLLLVPPHQPHRIRTARQGYRPDNDDHFVTVTGDMNSTSYFAFARRAMGIDWMTRHELAEAIPPAYSEFLARQMLP